MENVFIFTEKTLSSIFQWKWVSFWWKVMLYQYLSEFSSLCTVLTEFSLKISGVKCWIYYFSIVLHLDTLSVEGPHKFYIGWKGNGGSFFFKKRGGLNSHFLTPNPFFTPFPYPIYPRPLKYPSTPYPSILKQRKRDYD